MNKKQRELLSQLIMISVFMLVMFCMIVGLLFLLNFVQYKDVEKHCNDLDSEGYVVKFENKKCYVQIQYHTQNVWEEATYSLTSSGLFKAYGVRK